VKTLLRVLILIIFIFSAEVFAQATWQPMGSGLNNGTNGNVYAITSFNGKIIVGGSFTRAGNVTVQNIASYDPATNSWSALSTGIVGEVYALTTRSGELIAGGLITQAGSTNVNNIARWNGTNWLSLGSGTSGEVNALIVYNTDLIAGGNFTSAGGNSANNIAKWNGTTWSNLGSGLTGSGDRVNALTVFSGNLVAAGRFTNAGGNSASNIAKWNGSAWSTYSGDDFDDDVNALTVFNNELYAGGDFTHIEGSDRKYIAKWNGSNWVNVGGGLNDGVVNTLAVYKNTLIVGGNFRVTGTGLFVDRIVSWNGSSWSRMLTGHNDNVKALYTNLSTDTLLYTGGEYSTAGGKWAYHTAIWGNTQTISISGTARYDASNVVVSGRVRLLRMDVVTREVIVVDSANVAPDGGYLLPRVPKRDSLLRVMIFPDDELLDQAIDTGYVPTYYPSTIQWMNAGLLYANNSLSNIDIYVIRRNTSTMNGSTAATISGNVFLNIAPPMNMLVGPFPFLKSSIIYLKKDTSYVKSAVTDENQHYSLGTVQPGTYTISVQRLGYEVESRQLVVGAVNNDTVNFYLDTLNVIGIVNINSNVPDNYSLMQNYPNPFNPATKIKFALKQASFTEMKVYDVTGREIKTLVSESLKPGEYEVSFNAVNLPSGVYFYRINTEQFTETRKMILVK